MNITLLLKVYFTAAKVELLTTDPTSLSTVSSNVAFVAIGFMTLTESRVRFVFAHKGYNSRKSKSEK